MKNSRVAEYLAGASQRAEIVWPQSANGLGSFDIIGAERAQRSNERLTLVHVPNAFGLARLRGIDLNSELAASPEHGSELLERLASESVEFLEPIRDGHADGAFVTLCGAEPNCCSPMQYGGLYLERDRELLDIAMGLGFVALYVDGGEDAYLDIVSDLPCDALGWDVEATGITVASMREMRSGMTFTASPESEIGLILTSSPRTAGVCAHA